MELPELTQTAQLVLQRYNATRFKWRVRNGKAIFELFFFNEFTDTVMGHRPCAQLVVSTIQTTTQCNTWNHIFRVYKNNSGIYYINASLDYYEYQQLRNTLGIQDATSGEKFHYSKLFDELQKQSVSVIDHWNMARIVTVDDLPEAWKNKQVEDTEAKYFVGWYQNPQGKHPRQSNLEKTRAWIGESFYQLCKKKRLSSCWSDDPSKGKHLPIQAAELEIFS